MQAWSWVLKLRPGVGFGSHQPALLSLQQPFLTTTHMCMCSSASTTTLTAHRTHPNPPSPGPPSLLPHTAHLHPPVAGRGV
jgi:hypothetical protein